MTLDLATLTDRQKVRYRTARSDGRSNPGWSPWKVGTLYVARRETDLPKKFWRGTQRDSYKAGAIITLTIRAAEECAEYSCDDYDPQTNTWQVEDYELQFEPIDETPTPQARATDDPKDNFEIVLDVCGFTGKLRTTVRAESEAEALEMIHETIGQLKGNDCSIDIKPI